MMRTSNDKNKIAPAIINMSTEENSVRDKNLTKPYTIPIHEDNQTGKRMSLDGVRIIARLSPHVTVTFYKVSKVINVPAKMIDPSSKERFIQRTLLDEVSGQIQPGQLVALMGPSGNEISFEYVSNYVNRKWKNYITQHISWPSIEWCYR